MVIAMTSTNRPIDRKPRHRLFLLALLITLLLAGVVCWPKPSPQELIRQANLARDDETRVSLLQRALTSTHAPLPEAEALLCQSLANAGQWGKVEQLLARFECGQWSNKALVDLAQLGVQSSQWPSVEHLVAVMAERGELAEPRLAISCSLFHVQGQQENYLNAAEQLTALCPTQSAYWWQLVRIYERQEDDAAAIRTLESALSQPLPHHDRMAMNHQLIEHCISVGDRDRSRHVLRELQANGEHGPRLDVYSARILHLEGDVNQALVALRPALQELGEIPEAVRFRGILWEESGELERAVADFRRVIELTPNDEIVHFKLAQTYRRMARIDDDETKRQLGDKHYKEYLRLHQQAMRRKNLATPNN